MAAGHCRQRPGASPGDSACISTRGCAARSSHPCICSMGGKVGGATQQRAASPQLPLPAQLLPHRCSLQSPGQHVPPSAGPGGPIPQTLGFCRESQGWKIPSHDQGMGWFGADGGGWQQDEPRRQRGTLQPGVHQETGWGGGRKG